MSLEAILARINAQAQAEKEKILQQSHKEAADLMEQARLEAEQLEREILQREKATAEKKKQGLVVNARLKAKNAVLASKQRWIDAVLERAQEQTNKTRFKKQVISHEKTSEVSEEPKYYLENLRREYESEIAQVLFGQD